MSDFACFPIGGPAGGGESMKIDSASPCWATVTGSHTVMDGFRRAIPKVRRKSGRRPAHLAKMRSTLRPLSAWAFAQPESVYVVSTSARDEACDTIFI